MITGEVNEESFRKCDILNKWINEEGRKGINDIKTKWYPGFDQITNEMIKCTTNGLIKWGNLPHNGTMEWLNYYISKRNWGPRK